MGTKASSPIQTGGTQEPLEALTQKNAALEKENAELRRELQQRQIDGPVAEKKKFLIIALDGGAMKGLITALILQRLENACPGLLARTHMFAGTSTGSIGASVCAKGLSPETLKELYYMHGENIFRNKGIATSLLDLGNILGSKFDNEPLKQAVASIFPSSFKLRDLGKKILISAFDCDGESLPGNKQRRKCWSAKFLHNFNDEGEETVLDCILASTAAPTYFPLYHGFADGGLVCNEPVMAAISQVVSAKYGSCRLEDIVVLNVGTGEVENVLDTTPDANLGIAQWILPLISIFQFGQQEMTAFQGSALLGHRYHRCSPPLRGSKVDPWDSSHDNLMEMERVVNEFDLEPTIQFIREHFRE